LLGGVGRWEQRKYEGSGQVPFLLTKRGMGSDIHAGPLLPERAPSEGPRSTAAIGPAWTPFPSRGEPESYEEKS